MNYIWCGMILISLIAGAANGLLDETISAAFESASKSVSTVLSFAGVMCFWTGMLKIAEVSGACEKLQRLLSPIVGRLFPGTGENAKKYITMNLSANILGMGNAATPMGVKAMRELDEENGTPFHASDAMCMLVVLNTTSFQLIPSTIIALRTAAGSQRPLDIIVPIWIASAVSVVCAVMITKLVCRMRRK